MKFLTAIVAWVLLAAPALAQHDAEIEAAERSVRAWLALVDSNQYGHSWEQSASFFRAAITQEDWDAALQGARTPFGALQSREKANATYATTLPGAPDGEYVVFEFNTAFENKAAAVETVTAMRDIGGSWRVGGYFIR